VLDALLPRDQSMFIQRYQKGKKTLCTTETFISLDTRQKEASQEITLMAGRAIEEVLTEIRSHIEWIAQVAEALAWLDLTVTFVDLITRSPHSWVRPELTMNGPLIIQNGWHALVQESRNETVVPNDAYLNFDSNLKIITGANGSGKSTYLRTIGVINILAHIGCYVPAESASIRLTDQLLTRMSGMEVGDADEYSTFFAECKELAYLLKHANQRSLVLIDELGRSTSSLDGVGICWSSCESLLRRPACYTLLVTHFIELCQLPALYANVTNAHMEMRMEDGGMMQSTTGIGARTAASLHYLYKLREGQLGDAVQQYGISLASIAAFPPSLIAEARVTHSRLKQFVTQQQAAQASHKRHSQFSAIVPSTIIPTTPIPQPISKLEHLKRVFVDGWSHQLDEPNMHARQCLPSFRAAWKGLTHQQQQQQRKQQQRESQVHTANGEGARGGNGGQANGSSAVNNGNNNVDIIQP